MSLTLLVAMAMMMAQGDPVDAPRKSFNTCLTKFTNDSLEAKKEPTDFAKAASDACTTEKAALMSAMVKSEMQYGGKQAEAERYAGEEVQMMIDSFVGSYGEFLSSGSRHGAG